MLRTSLALLLILAVAPAAAQVHLSGEVGYATAGLADGLGPSVGVGYTRPVGQGAVSVTARFDAVSVDRDALAEGYLYDPFSATCTSDASEVPVDPYLCNPFESGNDFLGAYSAEVLYAPGVPVGVGLGVRFAEEVSEADGKATRVRPFATAVAVVPLSGRLSAQARARAGVGLAEGHVGLRLGL